VNTKEIFAKNLKNFRERKQLTQGQLAEPVGLDASFISKVESGKHFPDPEKIDAIAKVLGISPIALFSGRNEEKGVSSNIQPLVKKLEDTFELLITEKDKRIDELSGDKQNLNSQVNQLMSIVSELSSGLRSLNKA
jgi:transcriptional regulator with XRE-family HTH domain